MKLFNATNSLVDLPWGSNRLTVPPRGFSQDFMGTTDFVQMLVSTYNNEELAIVVAGPYELSMCASVPVAVNYVVQSMDEAIQKFGLKKETKKAEEPKKEEKKEPEPEPVKEPEPETVEPKEEEKPCPGEQCTEPKEVEETKTEEVAEVKSEEAPKTKKSKKKKEGTNN